MPIESIVARQNASATAESSSRLTQSVVIVRETSTTSVQCRSDNRPLIWRATVKYRSPIPSIGPSSISGLRSHGRAGASTAALAKHAGENEKVERQKRDLHGR